MNSMKGLMHLLVSKEHRGAGVLRRVMTFLCLFATFALFSQVDNVFVYGSVKDLSTARKIDGVTVTVYKNGGKLTDVVTNASGKYEVYLDYGAEYKLLWSKGGYVSKNIAIDTRNVSEEERVGGHGMNVDITLLEELQGVDFSILLEPFGKANYITAEANFMWDMEYTERMKSAQARLIKEYEDMKKQAGKLEENFAKLMQQGDAAMGAADYTKAVESFQGALGLKPKDPIATAKLSDAQMRLNEQQGDKLKEEQYAALIKTADGMFGKKEYEAAKGKYQEASNVKENEAYPKQKIKEIDTLLADLAKKAEEERKLKELNEKYDAAVKAGDDAFKVADYAGAKVKYNDALKLKAQEQYPKDKIAECNAKIEELAKKAEEEKKQKELDAKYQAAIAAADGAFNAANYEQARTRYTEALGFKPDEKYPKDQLAAIELKIKELADKAEQDRLQKELNDKYNAAIARADKDFKAAAYEAARSGYEEALTLKAEEKYPKDQLAAITKKLEELAAKEEEARKQKEIDEQYQAAIAAADADFKKAAYADARTGYEGALKIKPGQKYPQDQIANIQKKLDELALQEENERRQKELDAKYDAAIAEADKAFSKENWADAKAGFETATGLKPDIRYPKDRLLEIDRIIEERRLAEEADRKAKELDEQYAKLIADADKGYDKEDWSNALNDYKNASKLKPEEEYPKGRIADIETRMDQAARDKAEQERLAKEAAAMEAQYKELIADADKSFTARKYQYARSAYQDASELKPDEKYPKDQIAEIERLMEEEKRLAAEKLSAEQRAAEEAARLEAERLRQEQEARELEARYQDLIAAGDMAMGGENFDQARNKYTEALSVKSDAQYPKDKIAEIERLIAERSAMSAEEARLAEERRLAEEERKRLEREAAEAARLAAEEERRRLEGLKATDEQYQQAILEADKAFGEVDYDLARSLYGQALDIKPDETYPQARMEQIDKLQAELERKQREADEARRLAELQKEQRGNKSDVRVDLRKEEEAEKFMREARMREEAEKYERIKKMRGSLEETERMRIDDSAERRGTASQRSAQLRGDGAQLFEGSEAERLRNLEELLAFKDALSEAEKARIERARQETEAEYEKKLETRTAEQEQAQRWDEKHVDRVEDAREVAQELEAQERHRRELADSRRDEAAENAASKRGALEEIQQRGEQIAKDNVRAIDDKRTALQSGEAVKLQQAKTDRELVHQQLNVQPLNRPRDFKDYNRSKLATQYPPGVTEESYTEGNKVIIRRVVVQDNKADEYSKVIAKWGTFYFKNGQSIGEHVWINETAR